jgi:hypothetical protein
MWFVHCLLRLPIIGGLLLKILEILGWIIEWSIVMFIHVYERTRALAIDPYSKAMEEAATYDTWYAIRQAFEETPAQVKKIKAWIEHPNTIQYTPNLVQMRTNTIRSYMSLESRAPANVISSLGGLLFRNLGGICEDAMFSVSLIYTDPLVEEYLEELCKMIDWLYTCPLPLGRQVGGSFFDKSKAKESGSVSLLPKDMTSTDLNLAQSDDKFHSPDNAERVEVEPENLPISNDTDPSRPQTEEHLNISATRAKEKYEFFQECLQMYGRSALIFSNSFISGFCHFGVAKALFEKNLLPDIICGMDTIGLLITGLLCVLTDDELSSLFEDPRALFEPNAESKEREFTDDSKSKISNTLIQFMFEQDIINHEVLEQILDRYFGDLTIKEAYNRTGRKFNAFIKATNKADHVLILNRFSSPDIVISSLIRAVSEDIKVGEPINIMLKDKTTESRKKSAEDVEAFKASDISPVDARLIQFHTTSIAWETIQGRELDLLKSRLASMCNVNNYIISEVSSPISSTCTSKTFFGHLLTIMQGEINLFLEIFNLVGILPKGLQSIIEAGHSRMKFSPLSEDLHVSLVTNVTFSDLFDALHGCPLFSCSNNRGSSVTMKSRENFAPLTEGNTWSMLVSRGEQAVWSELNKIRTRCKVEKLLELASKRLFELINLKKNSLEHLNRRRKRTGNFKFFRSQNTRSMY